MDTEMEGGTTRTGEIDYKKNPTDSIDFTGNVILRIKADDSNLSASYRIKVNIHTIDTDTLFWSETAVRKLPSRLGAPVRQKTVSRGDEIFSFIEENDGTYTLSTTSTPSEDNWAKQSLNLSFIPDVGSMSATTDALWILSENGELFTSSDGGTTWSVVDNDWESLIGNYGDTVLGIKKQGDTKTFAQFPELDIAKVTIPTDFPVQGGSNFVTLTNKWTLSPVGFFTGGTTASGKLSNSTWAFDGTDWIKLSSGGIPRLEGASVIPYYNFRASSQSNAMLRYNVWMLVGGRMEDGSFNRTVYISYDNGVNWTKGVSSLQLPKSIPAMTQCDNVVHNTEMQANLSDIWKVKRAVRSRAEYEIAGDVITWGCPYIYLFGGYAPDGKLYDTIWRGVLTRLTFTPIF